MDLHKPSSATKSNREAIYSYFWARNSTENHGLTETLVFSLVFVGFLHSPHQETKDLVFVDFFKPGNCFVSLNLFTFEMRTEQEYYSIFSFFWSLMQKYIQTY